MKIVHLCLSCFFVDNYSYQENMLAKYHVKMGFDVTVIASLFSYNEKGKGCYLPGPSEKTDSNGFRVIRLAYKEPTRIYKILRRYKNFYDTLEQENPDLIFVHGVSMADADVVVKYLKRHKNVKLFADSHADYINSAKNKLSKYILHPIIWRYFSNLLEPYAEKIYGVTPMRCRFLHEMYHLNKEKIEFLPLGVDDESIPADRVSVRRRIRQELGVGEDNLLIFTGGKIDKLKNTHVLIDAFNELDNKDIHIVICGVLTPEMEYLKEKFNSNVHYLGWCNAERVMDCMVASDMACFPGTHSTLWEQSVGVGLPAIFKKWNEMTHVYVNGNCIFVEGSDYHEIALNLKKFTDGVFLKEMSQKAEEAKQGFLYSYISKKAIGY